MILPDARAHGTARGCVARRAAGGLRTPASLLSDQNTAQEDIHITSKDGVKTEGEAKTLLNGAALTAHNLAEFLGLPHMPLTKPDHGLHRDSCATAYHDESWQATGQATPRWLPASPRSVTSASDSAADQDDDARRMPGGASDDASSAEAAPHAASGSTARSEIVLQHNAIASPDADPAADGGAPSEPPAAPEAASAAVAAAAEAAHGAGAAGSSLKRTSAGSGTSGEGGRVALRPVHTTLFRPSAGAGTMPAIVEGVSLRKLPYVDLQQGPAVPLVSIGDAAQSARDRLSRKSKQALQGGQIKYHDGRPKLGELFESVAMQAKASGCERVAVLICGNKHLLRNCLALVKEHSGGDLEFEAHYESFGFV